MVLEAHVAVHLGLLIIAALAGRSLAGMGIVGPGGRYHCAFREIEIHIAFQEDGIGVEGSLREDYSPAFHCGSLYGAVDGLGVHGRGGIFAGAEVGDEERPML